MRGAAPGRELQGRYGTDKDDMLRVGSEVGEAGVLSGSPEHHTEGLHGQDGDAGTALCQKIMAVKTEPDLEKMLRQARVEALRRLLLGDGSTHA
jgi:hypothetical protein